MVHNQCYFIFMKDTFRFHFFHFVNCHRRSDIIAQHQIQFCLNQLSCFHFFKPCMGC